MTDLQRTTSASTWIWNGITSCRDSLLNGLCYRIGEHTSVRIQEDSWLPNLLHFKLPGEIDILNSLHRVSDLMDDSRTGWNRHIIQAAFPSNVSWLILSVPIFPREHDSFVWVPSATCAFSIRSSYRTNNRARFNGASRIDKKVWTLLWQSSLHERHKVVL